jgi:glutathione peroxidase
MSLYDISLERLDGKPDHLSNYRDQVLLVVNVASHCGFTPQYTGLEALQRKYAARGFQVLAFPCNQFGHQEPGSAETIAEFCESRFAVSFPMFAKTDVNGDQAHPLWQLLKSEAPGILGMEGIKWNFTKFLIGRDGKVVARYAPIDTPEKIERDLEAVLGPAA